MVNNHAFEKLILAFDKEQDDDIQKIIDSDNNNALLFSIVRRGPLQMLQLIHRYKNSVINARNSKGETMLMVAIQMGRLDFIQSLLELNADPNLVNMQQETVLDMAWHSKEMSEVLISHGAKQNKSIDPLSIFSLACEPSDLTILDNIDIDRMDNNGWTLLMLAARRNWVNCVRKLLDLGVDINRQAWHKQTALIVACDYCNFPVVEELVQRNANLDIQDDNNWTALMYACKNQYSQKTVKHLFEYGASLDLKNNKGKTAKDIATSNGNSTIAKML